MISNFALVYDTETTGFYNSKLPNNDPRQPHIVQLAAVIIDMGTFKEIAQLNTLIRFEGWDCSAEASAVHGITQEVAASGISEAAAVHIFRKMAFACERRIAHNDDFDKEILKLALLRFSDPDSVMTWLSMPADCTMKLSSPIMKLPPTERMKKAGRFGFKNPSLTETHEFFFDEPFSNAHDALADVRACLKIWQAIQERTANGMGESI